MGVDLKKELEQQKRKSERRTEDEVLKAYRELLAADDEVDEDVLGRIFDRAGAEGNYTLNNLDQGRIYHLDDIRKLCIAYRLRFLDASLYKGEIPYEAISKIKSLEKAQQMRLADFKMLAPAPMFNLVRKDRDPLLFLNLGNNHYYLIHKWGGDLHPLRKLVVYPFRSFTALLITVVAASFLISFGVPESVVDDGVGNTVMIRIIAFFYFFIGFSSMSLLYGFSRMKDFSDNLWNSRYTD